MHVLRLFFALFVCVLVTQIAPQADAEMVTITYSPSNDTWNPQEISVRVEDTISFAAVDKDDKVYLSVGKTCDDAIGKSTMHKIGPFNLPIPVPTNTSQTIPAMSKPSASQIFFDPTFKQAWGKLVGNSAKCGDKQIFQISLSPTSPSNNPKSIATNQTKPTPPANAAREDANGVNSDSRSSPQSQIASSAKPKSEAKGGISPIVAGMIGAVVAAGVGGLAFSGLLWYRRKRIRTESALETGDEKPRKPPPAADRALGTSDEKSSIPSPEADRSVSPDLFANMEEIEPPKYPGEGDTTVVTGRRVVLMAGVPVIRNSSSLGSIMLNKDEKLLRCSMNSSTGHLEAGSDQEVVNNNETNHIVVKET